MIQFEGTQTNQTVFFLDEDEFIDRFGRLNLINEYCYSCIVNETMAYGLIQTTGLTTNTKGSTLQDKGVGERGLASRGNTYDSRVIGIYFNPCNSISSNSEFSKTPDQRLIDMVETGNEEVLVTITAYNGVKYSMYYTFDVSNCDVGAGYIELVSSRTNNGMNWFYGAEGNFDENGKEFSGKALYLYEQDPFVPLEIPLRTSLTYPRRTTLSFSGNTFVNMEFGGTTHGRWEKIHLKFGELYEVKVTNKYNDDKIIINSIKGIVTNQDGVDRKNCVEFIKTGETIKLIVPPGEHEILAEADLPKKYFREPTDLFVFLKYDQYVSSLPGGAVKC